MNDPRTILSSLSKQLFEVIKKIDVTSQSDDLKEKEIDKSIEYLNQAIRDLDHTVEKLLSIKKEI